jgi:hypothetical protein
MTELSDSLLAPADRPAAQAPLPVPFEAHVELLGLFLSRRDAVVAGIQDLLNAQYKPQPYRENGRELARLFEDCFFALPDVTPEQARLRGQLQEAHWARGFRPREIPGMPNDLVHPAEMMTRAFHMWAQTRWPGRSGRIRNAHTLFNVYLVRQLALLCMRVWDGSGGASERLLQAQRVLDAVWSSSAADQPVLVRDVRWLIPVALSPATDDLAPYFEVAERIDTAFTDDDRLEILNAVVRTAGGHLRSYLHFYVVQQGMALDDGNLVLLTRKATALDFSQLIHALVPLLDAYERAVQSGDGKRRLALADTICQGVSPDPDLLVNRVDLLGAYTMVEHLFTATDQDGHAVYTPLGRRHVQRLEDYAARIARLVKPLAEDCRQFKPVDGAYSPYGILYGFASNLLEDMTLKFLQRDEVAGFALEDVFTAGDADKLAWVSGWRKLPHVDRKLKRLYAYPQRFAEDLFARVEQAFSTRAALDEASAAARTGRLFVVSGDDPEAGSKAAAVPELSTRYIGSSDGHVVAARRAAACDEKLLVNARLEGHFAVSYQTAGGWVVVTKDFLTEVLGEGRDVKIVGLPGAAAERLRLMCRGLVAG